MSEAGTRHAASAARSLLGAPACAASRRPSRSEAVLMACSSLAVRCKPSACRAPTLMRPISGGKEASHAAPESEIVIDCRVVIPDDRRVVVGQFLAALHVDAIPASPILHAS